MVGIYRCVGAVPLRFRGEGKDDDAADEASEGGQQQENPADGFAGERGKQLFFPVCSLRSEARPPVQREMLHCFEQQVKCAGSQARGEADKST